MSTDHSIASRQPEAVTRSEQRAYQRPHCDVYENADEFLLLADLPGVSKDALSIHVDQGEVVVETQRTVPPFIGKVVYNEFVEHDYRRRFALPASVDASTVLAELRDGVLQIRLPKSEAATPRQIPVRAA